MIADGLGLAALAAAVALAGLTAGLAVSRLCQWRPAGGLALVAATPLVPHVALGMGLSFDDILALDGVALLLVAFRPWTRRPAIPAVFSDKAVRALAATLLLGLVLLVAAAAASSLANSSSPGDALRMFLRSGGRFAFLGLVGTLAILSQPPTLRVALVARAIAAMGTFEAAFGIFAFMVPLPDRLGLEPTKSYSVLSGEVPGRIAGTLGLSPDFVGALFVLSIPVSVALALDAPRNGVRVAWLAVSALQMLALGLTFTRASLGVALVALAVLLLLRGRVAYLVGLAATLVPVALLTPAVERLTADVPDRFALWASGFRLMIDHPIFGIGSGRSVEVLRANPERYMDTPFGAATNAAHNTILLAGAEFGMLGFVGALLVNVALCVLALRLLWTCRDPQMSMIGAAAALATLGFLAQGMVNDLFTVAVVGTVAALLIGSHAFEAIPLDDLRAVRLLAVDRSGQSQAVQRAPSGKPSVPRE